ncbi:MAG: MerR family transcriptional regulator [Acidimicrobiales bacterium]
MTEAALLPIGSLAKATGVPVSTLRYYDEIGLIDATTRVGGKRRFEPETAGRVDFVRRAKRAGFELEQIRSLLDDESNDWKTVVAEQLHTLRSQRDELDAMISTLEDVQNCGCSKVATCPRSQDLC